MEADDVFEKNEIKSNKLVILIDVVLYIALFSLYFVSLYGYYSDILKAYVIKFYAAYFAICTVSIAAAIILFFKLKGKKYHIIKYYMILTAVLVSGGFILVSPSAIWFASVIVLAIVCRYFDRKLLITFSIITPIFMEIMIIVGFVSVGIVDINSIDLTEEVIDLLGDNFDVGKTVAYTSLGFADGIFDSSDWSVLWNFLQNTLLYYIILSICEIRLFLGINSSAVALMNEKVSVEKKAAVLNNDLKVAYNIQQAMLPEKENMSEVEETDFYASMKPAKEVGGDFFDYFRLDDEHVCFMIGDVSGKGVPASLFMVRTQTILTGLVPFNYNTDEVLAYANDSLCDRNVECLFATVWLGILNIKTGVLTYSSAGHNPPLFAKKDGKYEYMETNHDFVVAGASGMDYKRYTVQMQPGDRILLYTDGVTENQNEKEELYGDDRLRDFLNGNLNRSSKETVEMLGEELTGYMGEASQFDDITICALEFVKFKG